MAHSTQMVLLTTILLVGMKAAVAREFLVGGEAGWVVPNAENGVDYTSFSNNTQFVVGDSLVFMYKPRVHSVLSVTGAAFGECDTSEPLEEWKDGNSTITFDKAGRWWFICGTPTHCSKGQAVKITVSASTVPDIRTALSPAASAPGPETGAGNSLVESSSSKSVLILSTVILGASYFLL